MERRPLRRRAATALIVVMLAAVAVIGLSVLLRPGAEAARQPRNAPTVHRQVSKAVANADYVILGSNDLGMHCYQRSYSAFMILPPANTLKVQVFKKGAEGAKLVTSGIDVSYSIPGNTYSAGKTDFWDYASSYGFDLKPDVGITGSKLSGKMTLSADGRYWVAEYIPITPYDDQLVFDPLQAAKIIVTDKRTGAVLAKQPKMVVPVSDEMNCGLCHGPNASMDILEAHDEESGTTLVADLNAGTRHACAECHKDNALGMPGKPGVEPLSQAMHGWHADKMGPAATMATPCYACHPGQLTKCLRGEMAQRGFTCTSSGCHGDMTQVASSQAGGREAWLQEPTCGGCHGSKYAENPSTLYRNSYLMNGPEDMNGLIMCEDCHNSPHAEWPSLKAVDNAIPLRVQGVATYIRKCTVCHQREDGGIHGNTDA